MTSPALICAGLSGGTEVAVDSKYELAMSFTRLALLCHFRTGSYPLPVEQGRLARPGVPRHLRRRTFCTTAVIG